MASHLIGLLGLKRSGKDTVAARLVEQHGFTRIAFADPLKEAALALNPIIEPADYGTYWRLRSMVGVDGWETAKEHPEVRRTLQELGVAIRGLDEHFWLNIATRRAMEEPGPVVITDVRFFNEVDFVDHCGDTVRVIRDGKRYSEDAHVSENQVNDHPCDYVLSNDGSIEELHEKVDYLAAYLLQTP